MLFWKNGMFKVGPEVRLIRSDPRTRTNSLTNLHRVREHIQARLPIAKAAH